MYSHNEQTLLLTLARETLEAVANGQLPPAVDLDHLPPALLADRACFVTLRRRGDRSLRGCTGTLVARRSLAEEIIYMTIQTAYHDPRFYPVRVNEVAGLRIEISVLTPPEQLDFATPEELCHCLRPKIDGVTLKLDGRRATFLPQVWASYPDPVMFLSLLSEKMGYGPDVWRSRRVEVETYQAIVFEEE